MHEKFLQQPHSYTAKLMLCHMAIGKIGDKKGKGYEIMNEIVYSEKSIVH